MPQLRVSLLFCVSVLIIVRRHRVVGVQTARQSPIDIIERYAAVVTLPNSLQFSSYNTLLGSYVVQNTGLNAEITVMEPALAPTMEGGPLRGTTFRLQQLHFHWANSSRRGSEHLLNSKSYSMEAHFVHYNVSYWTFAEALKHKDGLAVIGILIKADTTQGSRNLNFQQVVEQISQIPLPGNKVPVKKDLLAWARPHLKRNAYFTYLGSLTAKPFTENVRWIVYKDVMVIHVSQIDPFRGLQDANGRKLTENFRKVQLLNGRVVEFVP